MQLLEDWHYEEFMPQPAQDDGEPWEKLPGVAFIHDGCVLAIGGVYQLEQDEGCVWAGLSKDIRPKTMILLHRAVGKLLDAAFETHPSWQFITAEVDPERREQGRWLRMLGFERREPDFYVLKRNRLKSVSLKYKH